MPSLSGVNKTGTAGRLLYSRSFLRTSKHLVFTFEYTVTERFCQIISISVIFHFDISLIRIHTECHIRRKGPWGCGPSQRYAVLILHFKLAMADFSFTSLYPWATSWEEVGSAARAVDSYIPYKGDLYPRFVQCPPDGFDRAVVISYIGIIHICPKAYHT